MGSLNGLMECDERKCFRTQPLRRPTCTFYLITDIYNNMCTDTPISCWFFLCHLCRSIGWRSWRSLPWSLPPLCMITNTPGPLTTFTSRPGNDLWQACLWSAPKLPQTNKQTNKQTPKRLPLSHNGHYDLYCLVFKYWYKSDPKCSPVRKWPYTFQYATIIDKQTYIYYEKCPEALKLGHRSHFYINYMFFIPDVFHVYVSLWELCSEKKQLQVPLVSLYYQP